MNEAPLLGQTKLVVPPVTMPPRDVCHAELVSIDPRIPELDRAIVIGAQEPDAQRGRSLLLPLAARRFDEAELLEPRIVRTPVVDEVEVPGRGGERQAPGREDCAMALEERVIALEVGTQFGH